MDALVVVAIIVGVVCFMQFVLHIAVLSDLKALTIKIEALIKSYEQPKQSPVSPAVLLPQAQVQQPVVPQVQTAPAVVPWNGQPVIGIGAAQQTAAPQVVSQVINEANNLANVAQPVIPSVAPVVANAVDGATLTKEEYEMVQQHRAARHNEEHM